MLRDALRRRSISEVSDLQSRLRTLDVKLLSLDPGVFAGSVSHVGLGDVTVEIVRTCPVLLIGAAREDSGGCLLLLDGAQGTHWDGRAVDPCDVALLEPGASFAAAHDDACASAFVSSRVAGVRAALMPPGKPPCDGPGPVPIRRGDRQAHGRVAAIIRAVEQAADSTPEILRGEEVQRSLRASLLDAMRRLFLPGGSTDQPGRRRAAARHRVVRDADAYLCANAARPVYTDDLCAALGVSASSLHEAFHATFGTSPHRFLKLRRLGMVRAALLSSSGPWRSVKAAALSHGFWHLGQFAHDYRMAYGEAPCETLARLRWHAV